MAIFMHVLAGFMSVPKPTDPLGLRLQSTDTAVDKAPDKETWSQPQGYAVFSLFITDTGGGTVLKFVLSSKL